MRPVKFIHTADIHLDMPFTSLNSFGSASVERRHEQRRLFKKIIQTAIDKKIDMLFISGDLFEHDYASKGSIAFLNECFYSIPNVKVFISPGNHDPIVKSSYYSFFEWAPNVYIFNNPIEEIILQDLEISIFGTCFTDFHMYESALKGFKISGKSSTNILISHGALDTVGGPDGYHTIYSRELENAGFDYAALGHIHKYMPEMAGGRAFYPGSPFALGFDEPGQHGIIYGSLTGDRLEYEFIPIDTREYITLRIDVSGSAASKEVIDRVVSRCDKALSPGNYHRIIVEGTVEADILEELEYIRKSIESEIQGGMAVYDLALLAGYNLQDISKGNDLRAIFIRKMISMIEHINDEAEKLKLEKVMQMGLQAIDGKKVKYL
ncbi:MAG: metallophosphoesterase family protein [Deltaproteobacteria bacterium]